MPGDILILDALDAAGGPMSRPVDLHRPGIAASPLDGTANRRCAEVCGR